MYHAPFDGRYTTTSVLPSPSKSPGTGTRDRRGLFPPSPETPLSLREFRFHHGHVGVRHRIAEKVGDAAGYNSEPKTLLNPPHNKNR
jgi:hypothetical protein